MDNKKKLRKLRKKINDQHRVCEMEMSKYNKMEKEYKDLEKSIYQESLSGVDIAYNASPALRAKAISLGMHKSKP